MQIQTRIKAKLKSPWQTFQAADRVREQKTSAGYLTMMLIFNADADGDL